MYWIQLDTKSYTDGFGKAKEEAGFRKSYDPTAYCNTFNLHGGLHLFLGYVGDLHKRVKGASGIIDAIADTITREKRLPLYVAEGTSRAKLAKINSVPYLRHCYEKLMACTGNVFVFGHSASANDAHIYSALFGSKIEVLYFGVYKPTDESVRLIESQLSMFQKLHKRKVDYVLYDAGSANVWGDL
ncbi:hypothetical protein ABIE08_001188 [Kaistia defluvii]|uniref:Uncharacterized protein n=1 Tax=Kaistia defluvii TaxID=410841 RepID=A0ABV2QWA5_9HYPH